MPALRIYAGHRAMAHIAREGLQPGDVSVIPAAAGGPKGLVLGPLDRFIFGSWLPASQQNVHLVGASIGAWRMATACLHDPVRAFERLERDYIAQDLAPEPGRKTPSAGAVSQRFGENLKRFFGGRVSEILEHPRFRLHVMTSRGRHILGREHRLGTPIGYLGAFMTNAVNRRAMGAWLERVIFSTGELGALPFATNDYPTRQVALSEVNFNDVLQASCSIPFMLKAVHDIAGAPPGAYWDGGITDYHLHLNYAHRPEGLVLFPHFQKAVVPGWLDKSLTWRHGVTAFLDRMVVLAPDPDWVRSLPYGKLPDRNDFLRYAGDLDGRMRTWNTAVAASARLADEFAEWVRRPEPARVQPL
jgi:hypothetical protein